MGAAAKTAAGLTLGVLFLVMVATIGLAGMVGGIASGTPAAVLLPSRSALADIPPRLLALYQQAAATCPGLPWTILAAIGKTETDHARNPHMVSAAGAIGPMQFEPATFTAYARPVPPGGANPPTPWDPVDAIYAAARLLCANGARDGRNLPAAIWAYNHDPAYVTHVLHIAATYNTGSEAPASALHAPTPAAAMAVAYARAQIGRPYRWGGNGPAAGDTGFDCSGLTQAAYATAGIHLPRTAQDQYTASPHLPAGAALMPGDLVFYGTPTHVHHVGLYTAAGHMINAPKPGTLVREEPYRYPGDHYLGATRPTATPPR